MDWDKDFQPFARLMNYDNLQKSEHDIGDHIEIVKNLTECLKCSERR